MTINKNQNLEYKDKNNNNVVKSTTLITLTLAQTWAALVAIIFTVAIVSYFSLNFYTNTNQEFKNLNEKTDKKLDKTDYNNDKLQENNNNVELTRKLNLVMEYFGIIDLGQQHNLNKKEKN